jgi:hypothetical protein
VVSELIIERWWQCKQDTGSNPKRRVQNRRRGWRSQNFDANDEGIWILEIRVEVSGKRLRTQSWLCGRDSANEVFGNHFFV